MDARDYCPHSTQLLSLFSDSFFHNPASRIIEACKRFCTMSPSYPPLSLPGLPDQDPASAKTQLSRSVLGYEVGRDVNVKAKCSRKSLHPVAKIPDISSNKRIKYLGAISRKMRYKVSQPKMDRKQNLHQKIMCYNFICYNLE